MKRRWTLRGGDPEVGTILIVTHHEHRLDELSAEMSSHGFYTVVATPDAVPALWSVSRFDLVVLTSDVRPEDRVKLETLTPPLAPTLLALDAVEETAMADRVRARLGS